MEHQHCVIIGSGPAGYTAAIYAARAGLKPIMFTGKEPGGQLMITTEVDNFPGYADGVNGPQMMEDLKKQAERFGTEVRYEMITEVNFDQHPKTIKTESGETISADAVIISTGASAKWLGLESEQRLMNKGVSACAVCDGFFFRKQDVAIVGGGDTAAEESTYLAKLCNKVHLIVRRDEMRASKIMQERVMNTPNLIVHWNTETQEILGEEEVKGVRIKNNKTGEVTTLDVSGFFVAIGHKPNTDLFQGILKTDEVGYIVNHAGTSKTDIEGVFVAGDAADKVYRQAITAAGMGCMAALDAERWLTEKGFV
jgi:thioredoxin reductase (NADPH)